MKSCNKIFKKVIKTNSKAKIWSYYHLWYSPWICLKLFVTLFLFIIKNLPIFIILNPLLGKRNPALSNMQAHIELNKKHHCVQTHNPCRGSRLTAKIRKWGVALLQVVTRGLNISSPSSHSSLTLESASGKATLDIMKHSLTLSHSPPWRTFWLKAFYKLL